MNDEMKVIMMLMPLVSAVTNSAVQIACEWMFSYYGLPNRHLCAVAAGVSGYWQSSVLWSTLVFVSCKFLGRKNVIY